MDLKTVLYEVRDGVAILTMNRPEALNALNSALHQDLTRALDAAAADGAVRAVVLTGAGRGFCSGGDIKAMVSRLDAADAGGPSPSPVDTLKDFHAMVLKLYEFDRPVIAAIHGPAVGAGMSIALACDFRIAAEDAVFGQAFIKIGLSPDGGSTWLLPRVVGAARAVQMSMTGENADARKALEWGLVHEVAPAGGDLTRSLELARKLAAFSPYAIKNAKRLLRASEGHTFREQLDMEADAQRGNAATPEFRAAVKAFVAKRG